MSAGSHLEWWRRGASPGQELCEDGWREPGGESKFEAADPAGPGVHPKGARPRGVPLRVMRAREVPGPGRPATLAHLETGKPGPAGPLHADCLRRQGLSKPKAT